MKEAIDLIMKRAGRKTARKRPAQGSNPGTAAVAKVPRISKHRPAATRSPLAAPPSVLENVPPLPEFLVPAAQIVKNGMARDITRVHMLRAVFEMCGLKPDVEIEKLPAQEDKPAVFRCAVSCQGLALVRASAAGKKRAEHLALRLIWEALRLSSHCAADFEPTNQEKPGSAGESTQLAGTQQRNRTTAKDISQFSAADAGQLVVVENLNADRDPIVTLNKTAMINGLKGTFVEETCKHGHICVYILQDRHVMQAAGFTMQMAKKRAAIASLTYLRSIAPTLKVKQLVDVYGPEVTKSTLDEIKATSGTTWKRTRRVCDGTGWDFAAKVEHLIKEYHTEGMLKDLVFSSEFDAEERNILSRVSRKYRLVCACVDGPSGKFIMLRHTPSVRDIVNAVQVSGPTDRYEVIWPDPPNHKP